MFMHQQTYIHTSVHTQMHTYTHTDAQMVKRIETRNKSGVYCVRVQTKEVAYKTLVRPQI